MPINSSEARKAGLVQLYDWDRATADVHTARGNVQFETWLIALLMDLTSRGRIVWFRYRGRGFDCHIDVAGEDHAGPTAFSLHREEADGVLSLIVTSAQADNFQLHQKYFGKELSDLWQAVLYRCAFPGIESIVQSLDDLGKEE